MGRSQRHKVHIQGYAADDHIVAQGAQAGDDGARPPPPALAPVDWTGELSPPPSLFSAGITPGGALSELTGKPLIATARQAAGAPFITNITPNLVDTGIDTPVRIAGANFLRTSQVMIGEVEMPTRYVSPTELIFQSTTEWEIGPVPIRVLNEGVESNILEFTFAESAPLFRVERCVPEFVMNDAGPTEIVVEGRGFVSGAVVYEDELEAEGSTFISETEMMFTSAIDSEGGYVQIRVKRGEEFTNAVSFQYRVPVAR
jgi:IPT/TIG domain